MPTASNPAVARSPVFLMVMGLLLLLNVLVKIVLLRGPKVARSPLFVRLIDAPGEMNGIVVADRHVPTKTQSEYRVKLIELFETMMIAWAAAVVGAAAQTSRVVAKRCPGQKKAAVRPP